MGVEQFVVHIRLILATCRITKSEATRRTCFPESKTQKCVGGRGALS